MGGNSELVSMMRLSGRVTFISGTIDWKNPFFDIFSSFLSAISDAFSCYEKLCLIFCTQYLIYEFQILNMNMNNEHEKPVLTEKIVENISLIENFFRDTCIRSAAIALVCCRFDVLLSLFRLSWSVLITRRKIWLLCTGHICTKLHYYTHLILMWAQIK